MTTKKCTYCNYVNDSRNGFCTRCGAQLPYGDPSAYNVQSNITGNQYAHGGVSGSTFDGNALALFFRSVLVGIVSIITLFIAAPAMMCWQERWIAKHTVLSGQRLEFEGRGITLLGKCVLWVLLTIITIGIYGLFVPGKQKKWFVSNTRFASTGGVSEYVGSSIGVWARTWLVMFVSLITIGIGSFGMVCWFNRRILARTYICGRQLRFTGRAAAYFGKCVVWFLLTIITIGIYGLFLPKAQKKWMTERTIIN